jgi:lysylphosphatidylglycerol synthetase-like protein (DUF2156 family)
MKTPLKPLTRFALIISGVVPAVFALIMIFAPGLLNSLLFPPPFEPLGRAIMLFTAASYLSLTTGMIYSLTQQDWRVARGFLAVTGSYNVLSIIVSLLLAVNPPGVPLIVWLYVVLALIYVTLLVICWRQQDSQS